MFKCTECGSEYKEKPDYCDCGNNEFVEETDTIEQPVIVHIEEKSEPKGASVSEKAINQGDKIYHKYNVDPISLVIFLICIILSLVIIFIPIKTPEISETTQDQKLFVTEKIPSIDKIWKESVELKEAVEPKTQQVITVIKQTPAPKPISKPATVQKVKQQAKPVQQKPANVNKQVEQNKAIETKKTAEEVAKKYEEVKKAAEDLQESMFAKQEFAQYKTNLRNTIGKRIDFTRVVGDGECEISFTIDSNGKLINGKFAKQSSNITLNDAVYKAFMLSRSFNPPPSGYKNETLVLKVKFYNGNFSISLG